MDLCFEMSKILREESFFGVIVLGVCVFKRFKFFLKCRQLMLTVKQKADC